MFRSRALPYPTSANQLILVSFLALYWELAFIRWAPMQVRLLAYFSNYLLIAALFGIGLGMLLARNRRRLGVYFPIGLFGLTFLILALEKANFVIPLVSEGEFVWNYLAHIEPGGAVSYGLLIGLFFAVVGVFVLLGQEVGLALKPFASLTGYSFNILGSLLGVLGFALVSYLETPPPVWFAIGIALHATYLLSLRGALGQVVLASVLLLGVVAMTGQDAWGQNGVVERYWSPYYEIEVSPIAGVQSGAFDVVVNKDSHQQALDLSGDGQLGPDLAGRRRLYDMPYRFNEPHRVLILGAGTGNDAAAAVRNAPDAVVDAVEIDPVIARIGSQHPEHPYAEPNVHLVIDDARSYIQHTDEQYDLIVFGFLDSHRLFSHMSSVRMDNYVYTLEHFQQVRKRLAPGGVVAVTFTVHEKWIAERISTLLEEVFGHPPLVYQGNQSGWGTLFLAANDPLAAPDDSLQLTAAEAAGIAPQRSRATWQYTDVEGFLPAGMLEGDALVVRDDWPFLYMRSASIPPNYVLVLALTAVGALLLIGRLVPRMDVRSTGNWRFFLLGVAFALLQTRGVTEVALIVGSTWTTNSIVISATLLMILMANMVVARWRVNLAVAYAGLFAVLVLNYLIPLQVVLSLDFSVQVAFAGIRVGAPLFFAGIIFARYVQEARELSAAIGANLIGAVVGGLLEYTSLIFGLRPLYLFAIAFYALAAVIASGLPGRASSDAESSTLPAANEA